jgi:hypothetical protein
MFDTLQLRLIAQPNDAVDEAALERARRAARPKNTSGVYAADLRAYEGWCADRFCCEPRV